VGHGGGELLHELVIDLVDHNEPLGGGAHLAAVHHSAHDTHLHGGVDVRVLEHDERVGAAELQHEPLEVTAGNLADRRPRLL